MPTTTAPPRYPATDVGLAQALAALGATPVAVADTLLAGGHRGERGCAANCPIAQYLRDVFPDAMEVNVDITEVEVYLGDDPGMWAETPEPVAGFLTDFDERRRFQDLAQSVEAGVS